MTAKGLDRLDMLILETLQRDASIPAADLAERVRSSKSVVWRRIQEMVGSGVIRARVAIINPRSIGLNVLVFVRIKMGAHVKDTLPQFTKTVQEFPEVLECHSLLGELDFLLKVIVPTLDAYEEFFTKKLSRIEGVREITSSVSMGEIVSTTRLPLRSVEWGPVAPRGPSASGGDKESAFQSGASRELSDGTKALVVINQGHETTANPLSGRGFT